MSPRSAPESGVYFQIPEKLESSLRVKFNESQLEAIKETLKSTGVTLIQGPPGTGKTKTVIGTMSVLLQSFQREPVRPAPALMQVESQSPVDDSRRSPWLSLAYDDWRDHIFDDCLLDIVNYYGFTHYPKSDRRVHLIRKGDDDEQCPEKILVCGPSNASVDEIVKKVLEEGLLDQNGNPYRPFIVRIGENFDSSVEHVSLDRLV
jgi:senataxin